MTILLPHFWDLLCLAGGTLVTWGLYLVWPPLALIFVGLVLLALALLGVLWSEKL